MVASEKRVFEPNAVLVYEAAIWEDNNGKHADPAMCDLLYLDGNRLGGELYTKEAWEDEGKPSFVLRNDRYFKVMPDGEEEFFCRAGLSIRDQEPVEGDRIQLLPEMHVVKVDETDLYDEDWRKEFHLKRIICVYVFNRRRAVYCCEMTPSYELQSFGSQYELDIDYDHPNYDEISEDASEEVRSADAGCEQFSYIHCGNVDDILKTEIGKDGCCFPPEGKSGGYKVTGLVSVTEEDAYEEISEVQNKNNGDL
jgi:hypothetical protein